MLKPMEENLSKPLKEVLIDIQERITTDTHYFGVKTMKNPMDFWVYREMIFDHKPDIVIEIGNFRGGSALAFAHILDHIGKGKVIGLDIDHSQIPEIVEKHKRIFLIEGDACKNIEKVKSLIKSTDRVLVFEDSAHTYINTLNVLNLYSKLIKSGDYIIVEDSICHHGLSIGPNPGPYEAIEEFIKKNGSSFESDRKKENFGVTWCPKGFIRKKGTEIESTVVKSGVSLSSNSNLRDSIRKIYINITPPIIVSTLRYLRGRS